MSDKPILFSGPMVRALLAGTKTQTRRTIKPRVHSSLFDGTWADSYVLDPGNKDWRERDLRIAVGDRLWVREAWTLHDRASDVGTVAYQATIKSHGWTETIEQFPRDVTLATRVQPVQQGWRPSIHMPRWASRLTLTVTDVRVERLQDIGTADAMAEGIERSGDGYAAPGMSWVGSPELAYRCLWEAINGPGSWAANPWVAAYTFTVQHGNIDALVRAA